MKPARSKIKSPKEVIKIASRARRKGLKIVTTNGCFDLLHIGHARYLEKAKNLGDILIVGVNSDRSVRLSKGDHRPIIKARDRAEMVAALGAVDYVFIFNGKTPDSWLLKIKPHMHAKGGDRRMKEIPEKEIVKKCGGRIVLLPYVQNRSTTAIIKKAANIH